MSIITDEILCDINIITGQVEVIENEKGDEDIYDICLHCEYLMTGDIDITPDEVYSVKTRAEECYQKYNKNTNRHLLKKVIAACEDMETKNNTRAT